MNVSRILALFIAAIFVLSACQQPVETKTPNGKLNGLHKYYYPDGTLYLEGNFKDSVPHGSVKQYFKNGQVYEEANYVNGMQYGISKRYYETGKLSMEIPYDSGRVHGIKKKFRKDGTTAYEAPYHYDQPCVGLKEYYTTGELVEKLPRIVIEEDNRVWTDNRYILNISVTGGLKAEFYKGSLTDYKYIGDKAEKLYTERDGTARIDYFVGRGMLIMENINIIAKVKTDLDNYYIIQRPYNIAVQNR